MVAKKRSTSKAKPKPKTKALTEEQRYERREKIADLYRQEMPLRQIGKKVKLSHTQVGVEIEKIKKVWAEEHRKSLVDMVSEDLKKLQYVARKAWEGYAKSLLTRVVKSTVSVDKHITLKNEDGSTYSSPVTEVRETTQRIPQSGEPRYLQIVIDTIVERHKLLGTYNHKDDEDGDEPVEEVKLTSEVYLPGLSGPITAEMFEALKGSAGENGFADFWHALEAMLPNQNPHEFYADGEAPDGPAS